MEDISNIKNVIQDSNIIGESLIEAVMKLNKEEFIEYVNSETNNDFWFRIMGEYEDEGVYPRFLDAIQEKFGVECIKKIVEFRIENSRGFDAFSGFTAKGIEEALLAIQQEELDSGYMVDVMAMIHKNQYKVPYGDKSFDKINISRLLLATGDAELLRKIVTGDEELASKIYGKEWKFKEGERPVHLPGNPNYYQLLLSLDELNLIKEIFEKQKQPGFFNENKLVEEIISIKKSPEFIKRCVEEKIVDDPELLKTLVIATKDPEYLIECQKKGLINITEEEIIALQIASKGLDAKKIADNVNRYNGLNIGLTVYTDLNPKLVREAGNRLGNDREQLRGDGQKQVEQPED